VMYMRIASISCSCEAIHDLASPRLGCKDDGTCIWCSHNVCYRLKTN
jgi:hypothetical protein